MSDTLSSLFSLVRDNVCGTPVLLLAVCLLLAISQLSPTWSARLGLTRSKGVTVPRPSDPPSEQEYEPWPSPPPELDFCFSLASEPKFRPFRWGPNYPINMGIRPLDPTKWLVLHNSYPSYARLREARHRVYGERSVRTLPHPTHRHHVAALEAARAIAAFLASRYPGVFSVEPAGADQSPDGQDVRAISRFAQPDVGLDEKRWTLMDLGEGGDDAMTVAGELTPDDLALLLPDEPEGGEEEEEEEEEEQDVQYRFIAGSICTAGFWRLQDKIGTTLREIHRNGKVPQYDTKLQGPMDRFFSKLHPNKPVERNNYFFQVLSSSDPLGSVAALHDGSLVPDILSSSDPRSSPLSGRAPSCPPAPSSQTPSSRLGEKELLDATELSWSHTTNGPERLFDQVTKRPRAPTDLDLDLDPPAPADEQGSDQSNQGSSSASTNQPGEENASLRTASKTQTAPFEFTLPTPTDDPSRVVMRTERQTLRRLPNSRAILFTIRTYLVPLPTMAQEPNVPGRLASAIRSWPPDVRRYKGLELYERVVLPYLDAAQDAQDRAALA